MAESCCSRRRFQMGDAVVRVSENGRKEEGYTLLARNSWLVSQGGDEKGRCHRRRIGNWVASRGSPEPREESPVDIRWQQLAAVFAVEKPGHMDGTATRSFQFFDQTGAAAFKVFLNFGGPIPPEREARFIELRTMFKR